MVIAAKNAEGREDINYALSIANEDGYYYKPRIDLDLLFNIPKDNVIVTSACISGWNYGGCRRNLAKNDMIILAIIFSLKYNIIIQKNKNV